jgi:uncharacterized protein YgfB (UPF0149 family)
MAAFFTAILTWIGINPVAAAAIAAAIAGLFVMNTNVAPGLKAKIQEKFGGAKAKLEADKVAITGKAAVDKTTITAKAAAFQDDIQGFLAGLGIVQDAKLIKGDFDASTAFFFNRALSHAVAKIVLPEDKDAAAKHYADIAMLIAKGSNVTSTITVTPTA